MSLELKKDIHGGHVDIEEGEREDMEDSLCLWSEKVEGNKNYRPGGRGRWVAEDELQLGKLKNLPPIRVY